MDDDLDPTVGEVLAEITRRLEMTGIETARLDARILVGIALGIDETAVFGYPERRLNVNELIRLDGLVARRSGREPMARITGTREFWSLPFKVTDDTLVPRPDSETLVEAVLERIMNPLCPFEPEGDLRHKPSHGNDPAYVDRALATIDTRDARLEILDLGTGTGCLLLALLSELPQARGMGVDINPGAIATAQGNAEALGLADRARFQTGTWSAGGAGTFDIVVANPPYIPSAEIEELMPEVAWFEPIVALDGGNDGLDSIREIVADLGRRLAVNGIVCIEVGQGQAMGAARILRDACLQRIEIKRDLAGIERCVLGSASKL